MDPVTPPPPKKSSSIGMTGLALAIPGIMLAAPIVSCLIGVWLDRKFGTGSKLTIIFLILGLLAGGRETFRLIRKLNAEQDRLEK
jgi:F0F1-type ATP synthase assembly protein I